MTHVLFSILLAAAQAAGVLLRQDEALAVAFPGARTRREVAFLTAEQKSAIESRARAKLGTEILSYYVAESSGTLRGHAFFDTHPVRTLEETVMVVVAPDGAVARVETLAFFEPDDYLPSPRWYALFAGKRLEPKLRVGGGVAAVSGATLTTRAVTAAVRRALAAHAVLVLGRMEP